MDCHFKEAVPFQVAAKTELQEVAKMAFRKVSNTLMNIATCMKMINGCFEGRYVLGTIRYKIRFLPENVWIYQV
jgi:hypothetical protein